MGRQRSSDSLISQFVVLSDIWWRRRLQQSRALSCSSVSVPVSSIDVLLHPLWHPHVLDGTLSPTKCPIALSLVLGCRIRAPRIHPQGRHEGRPSALRSMRLCMGRAGGDAGGRRHRVRPHSPIRHLGNKPESSRSLLNVQHIPAGHYLFALNRPTSRACGSLSWELRSRRQRSISFFVGGVAQRDGTTSRSAQ